MTTALLNTVILTFHPNNLGALRRDTLICLLHNDRLGRQVRLRGDLLAASFSTTDLAVTTFSCAAFSAIAFSTAAGTSTVCIRGTRTS